MSRILARFSCVALLPIAVFGQSAETRPAFEAADVHVAPKLRQPEMQGPYLRGDHFEIRQATMLNLISEAYGKDPQDIWGGPSWLEMNRYDILALMPKKMPAAKAALETRKAMLRALLADRFQLVVHDDQQPMPALALTAAGKHPQLKKAEESADFECKYDGISADGRVAGEGVPVAMLQATCHNMTMKAFAETIRTMPFGDRYFNHLVVVDQTELAGAWDFTFKFSFPGRRGGAAAAGFVALPDAIERQLGLKLESTKAPLPVLVVDRVNDKPTANAPNIAAILHTVLAPTEFEVASIKPSNPNHQDLDFNIMRGGKVDMQGVTLKFLIQEAWHLNNDMTPDLPKWMEEDRYDIIAKAPAASLLSEEWQGLPIDYDTISLMVRNLLADRFKLAVHMEERPISAYNLVALKPKLKPADPAGRTRFKEGPASAADAKNDPRNKMPILGRFVTVQNMTLAQFAEQLPNIAGGYIHTPVLDKTGLEGSFDFTLSFSGAGAFRGGASGGGRSGEAPPSGDTAADPSGAISLFEAVEKQLGLKLESVKRPVPVLVIDHVERKPTEN